VNVRGIGSAPVSFGVYGSVEALAVPPLALLDHAVSAGYGGMELGPPGFFGTPQETADAFGERGLHVIGAYVPIHFTADDATLEADLARMAITLQELVAAARPTGLAILADEGSETLLHHPTRAWDDRRLALDEDGWRRLAVGVARAVELADGAGIATSFHPHISTYVESPWEVERLLESTTVDLTIDTGHVWLAGGDPTELLQGYAERVNHVHLKDVRGEVLARARADRRTDFDAWWGDVATPLGAGDVDLDAFLAGLARTDYDGWLVVEQDRLPLTDEPIEPVAKEQAANRRWVEDALAPTGLVAGRPS
jgi:inosose dehydratase